MTDPSSSPNRWLIILTGIVAILFGLFAIAMPAAMLASLVLVFALFVIANALIMLARGVLARERTRRWLLLAGGLITLVIGLLAFFRPAGFVIALVLLVALWALFMGVFQIYAGIVARGAPYWWLMVLTGAIGVIVGLYIFTQPLAGTVALVWVLGIYAIVYGVGELVQLFLPDPVANAMKPPRYT